MNRTPKNLASVSCHTPWQRPLSLLPVFALALLCATSPVAAEQSAVVSGLPLMSPAVIGVAEGITDSVVFGTDGPRAPADAALTESELSQIRGRFTDSGQLPTSSATKTAVILWDELGADNHRTQHQDISGSGNVQSNTVSLSY